MERRPRPPATTTAAAGREPAEPRIIEAREIFTDGREVIIVHNEERYRLRVTSKGKLILTK
jgi:hemin uptake protein HemP